MNDITQQKKIEIIDLGKLSLATWPGSVAVKDDAYSDDTIIQALDEYYVPVEAHAATRCIDGRHDPALNESHLGPQMPGGAPGAALAYRLGVEDSDLTRATFFDDAESMIETFLRLDLSPGGHKDDQASEGRVGCGALDSMAAIVGNMTNPQLVEDHKRLVKTILADDFSRDDYLRIMGAALVLQSRSDEYFRDNSKVLDALEDKAPGSVSVLEGTHEEAYVFVNFVEGTTFSSNRFAAKFGVQAFGYDIWRSKQLAHRLFGISHSDAAYKRFVHARVMITIATLMTLTNGSQHIFVRTEQ
ncbi:hypothetical protein I8H83_00275 [Candidatus Saccharibacteria bacterium]|nr:hypothetical protein [Candidatus Saccharibacteria bacterium]